MITLLVIDNTLASRISCLVDLNTICILFTFLLVSKILEDSGLFNRASISMLKLSHSKLRRAIIFLLIVTSFTAMLIMNDTAIFITVPLAIAIARISGTDESKLVVLTSIAANIGSMTTPIGNPQNIIIWSRWKIPFTYFIQYMMPFFLTAFFTLILYTIAIVPDHKIKDKPPQVVMNKKKAVLGIILFALNLTMIETLQPALALLITLFILFLTYKRILKTIDYTLVLIFILMFIDFGEISHLLSLYKHFTLSDSTQIYLASILLSQIISNVPATILLENKVTNPYPLLVGTNIGGVGLITGSMANIIALRLSSTSTSEFHKYQLPYFAFTVLVLYILLVA